jgi:hypothetical protein
VSALLLVLVAVIAFSGAPATATLQPPSPPPTTVADNPYIPQDQNLSSCVSALPRPGCGSKSQGGWRQTLVFGVVVAGLGFIGWRLVRSVRRRGAPAGRASASENPDGPPVGTAP